MAQLAEPFRLYSLLLALLPDQRLVDVWDHAWKKKKINVITVYILEQLSFNFSNHSQLLPCNKELPQQC